MKNCIILSLVCLIPMGCTFSGSKSSSKVKLQLPAKQSSSILTKAVASSTNSAQWGYKPLTDLNQSDCFAIFLQASDLNRGTCYSQDGNTAVAISELYGQYKAGEMVEIETSVGEGRTFGVFAFTAADGKCAGAKTPDFRSSNYSQPLFVGAKTTTLQANSNQVAIDISMENSVPIAYCTGDAFVELQNNSWPPCPVQIEKVAYSDGQIKLNGGCLNNIQKISLSDTGSVIDMNLKQVSSNEVLIRPTSSSFNFKSKLLYKLFITSALGQVLETTFSVNFETNSIPATAIKTMYFQTQAGALIGDILPRTWGYTYIVYPPAGETLVYVNPIGSFDLSSIYLTSNLFVVSTAFSGNTLREMAQSGIEIYSQGVYFSEPNCTGNVMIYAQTPRATVRGDIIVEPQSCTQNATTNIWTCQSWNYYHLRGSPTFTENVTYSSMANNGWGTNGAFNYCNNTNGTITTGAFVYSASQKVPFADGDPSVKRYDSPQLVIPK